MVDEKIDRLDFMGKKSWMSPEGERKAREGLEELFRDGHPGASGVQVRGAVDHFIKMGTEQRGIYRTNWERAALVQSGGKRPPTPHPEEPRGIQMDYRVRRPPFEAAVPILKRPEESREQFLERENQELKARVFKLEQQVKQLMQEKQ